MITGQPAVFAAIAAVLYAVHHAAEPLTVPRPPAGKTAAKGAQAVHVTTQTLILAAAVVVAAVVLHLHLTLTWTAAGLVVNAAGHYAVDAGAPDVPVAGTPNATPLPAQALHWLTLLASALIASR